MHPSVMSETLSRDTVGKYKTSSDHQIHVVMCSLFIAEHQRSFPHITLLRKASNMSHRLPSALTKLSGSPPFLHTCFVIIRSVLHNTKQVLPLSCLRSNTRSNVFDPVIYFVVWRASTSESVMRQNYTTFSLHQTAFFVSRKTFEMSFLPELMRSKRREVSLIDSSLWSIQRPWKVYITLDNAKGSLLSVLYPHEG